MADEPDNPPSVEPHLAAAYQLESIGELKRAVAECRQALAVTPDSAEAYNLLGLSSNKMTSKAKRQKPFAWPRS
jgi:Flp pilus assembly protein TadD